MRDRVTTCLCKLSSPYTYRYRKCLPIVHACDMIINHASYSLDTQKLIYIQNALLYFVVALHCLFGCMRVLAFRSLPSISATKARPLVVVTHARHDLRLVCLKPNAPIHHRSPRAPVTIVVRAAL